MKTTVKAQTHSGQSKERLNAKMLSEMESETHVC